MPGSAAVEAQRTLDRSSVPVRVLLWLQPDTDEVLDRVRGQTSDLQVELLVDAFESMPRDLGAQLRVAQGLSRQHRASLVIWFVKQADAESHFLVNIAIPETRRLLSRDLGPWDTKAGALRLSSAAKESAALVVRAAIQAVLGGSTIGEHDPERFDDAAEPRAGGDPISTTASAAPASGRDPASLNDATQSPERRVLARPVDRQLPAVTSNGRDWPWAVGFEWQLLYDGAKNKPLAECGLLRAERRVQWLNASAVVGGCLNREIDSDDYGRFRVARQEATIGASAILLRTGVEASLGARVGVVFYERTTLPAPGAASPKTHAIGVMAPELRLRVPARASRIQAGFALGLDFVTSSLSIGYDDPAAPVPDHFIPVARMSVIQPYAALGLALRL